jgi:KUP system potassium uptake protein
VDTLLLLLVARPLWNWPAWKMALAAVVFGSLEVTFLAANLSKVAHGGWVPLLLALAVITVMTTWRRGRQLVSDRRRDKEGSLAEFVQHVRDKKLPRAAGIAVFPHPNKGTTPLALRANVEHNHIIHEHVVIVSVETTNVPHVPWDEAFTHDDLGYSDDGIEYLNIQIGFSDTPNIPRALRRACASDVLGIEAAKMSRASYFLSRGAIQTTRSHTMARWRKRLFVVLATNAASPAARFQLPRRRTVTMGTDVEI